MRKLASNVDGYRAPLAAAFVCYVSVACGGPVDERVSEGRGSILQGNPAPDDSAVVAIFDYESGSLCTGTLIAPNAVLTARHCVAPTYNQFQGGTVCGFTYFGSPTDAANLLVTSAEDAFSSATYTGAEVLIPTLEAQHCGTDQAIVILSDLVPPSEAIPIVPRVDVPVDASELYSAVGYGEYDCVGSGAGVRRRLDGLTVQCIEGQCPGYVADDREWVGSIGVCSGDSGGPALDSEGRVIGVTSRGGAPTQGATGSIYGSITKWSSWIQSSALHAASVGGYSPAVWATGGSTDPRYSYPIGYSCQSDDLCPSKHCIGETGARYCTRECNSGVPCPAGYECVGTPSLCVRSANATGTDAGTLLDAGDDADVVVPSKPVRAESSSCASAVTSQRESNGFLAVLGLLLSCAVAGRVRRKL